jgi:flagellar motility protein MotE (MotC chaperone)
MIRIIRDFRLIPVVLIAAACLFVLKVIGIVADGGYTLGAGHLAKTDLIARESAKLAASQLLRPPALTEAQQAPAAPKQSWAQEMFNYPDVTGSVGAAKSATGSAGEKDKPQPGKPVTAKDKEKQEPAKPGEAASAEAKDQAKPAEPKAPPANTISADAKPLSVAERAILERLQERRQELDQRERELDMRETLLQATEKRIDARAAELKETESRITAALQKKDEAEQARFKSLVTMYESMKAKDAAKIFDRLDIRLATEVANLINPRRMSDIMAQMSPEAAERLTVELANRNAATAKAPAAQDLPKIEGRPNGS